MSKKFLCWIGIHRPLKIMDASLYIQDKNNKTSFDAECDCGKEWFTDNFNGWIGFRIEKVKPKLGYFKGYKMP